MKELTILQEALQDEPDAEARAIIRAGIARLREYERLCEQDTAKVPVLCAWCLQEENIAPNPTDSHGVCKRHAEDMYRRYKSRKVTQGAA